MKMKFLRVFVCLFCVGVPFLTKDLSAQTPANTYDFFPLAKGANWKYEYYSSYTDKNISLLLEASADSGIIQLRVLDSLTYNDTTIAWSVEEYDSLKVWIYNVYQQLDTTYWKVDTVMKTMYETTTGIHEIIGFSTVWEFTSPQDTLAVYRYSESDSNQIHVLNYHHDFNHRDTLTFKAGDGLVSINGFGARAGVTQQEWKKKVSLIGSVTSVNVSLPFVPSSYKLHQNYPNPFNPVTTISYNVPLRSNIRLTLYDFLGREVATLVNEEKPPGQYAVSWDASGYSSGVYFCRLSAGSFISARRMILLK